MLADNGIRVLRQSSLIETEPWGVIDQPRFINLAIEAETIFSPEQLLILLKGVEKDMGREGAVRWGPRVIDLDILFYDDLVIDRAELKIPHPHLHERMFVLKPLSEIAPDKVHPVIGKTVRELFESLITRLE
jgi:2-amino-4-hydroxy-6-hydroxymethyldihydropteridine diphosphokinase